MKAKKTTLDPEVFFKAARLLSDIDPDQMGCCSAICAVTTPKGTRCVLFFASLFRDSGFACAPFYWWSYYPYEREPRIFALLLAHHISKQHEKFQR